MFGPSFPKAHGVVVLCAHNFGARSKRLKHPGYQVSSK